MRTLRRLPILFAALLVACAPAAGLPAPTSTPSATIAPGVYTLQPSPLVWQLVTIVDGDVANPAGAVFEWNCNGQSWAIGTMPARVVDDQLRFADERFPIAQGRLTGGWRRGADPRSLARPTCPPR